MSNVFQKVKNNLVAKNDHYIVKHPTRFATTERKYFRVSVLANSFSPTDRFDNWYITLAEEAGYSDLPKKIMIEKGKKYGNQIKDSQATKGTKMHALIEKYYKQNDLYKMVEWKNQLENFFPFTQVFQPIALETSVFYENLFDENAKVTPSGKLIGIAGTFDGLGYVNGEKLSTEKKGSPLFSSPFISMIDWKRPRNIKYPIKKYYDKITYPLIPYGLQLACYAAAINQLTNNQYKVNKGIVNVAPEFSKKNVKCQTNYPYYFSPSAIKWYWENAKKMMVALALNKKDSFDFASFEKETEKQGFLGTRLYYLK
jgi:hypothetical protein